jgi:hypothetical protein
MIGFPVIRFITPAVIMALNTLSNLLHLNRKGVFFNTLG